MTSIHKQRILWFAGALYTYKRIEIGNDVFYRSQDFYVWERDGGAMVIHNPYWFYSVFESACNSYGMTVDDYFFGDLLKIPNPRAN